MFNVDRFSSATLRPVSFLSTFCHFIKHLEELGWLQRSDGGGEEGGEEAEEQHSLIKCPVAVA